MYIHPVVYLTTNSTYKTWITTNARAKWKKWSPEGNLYIGPPLAYRRGNGLSAIGIGSIFTLLTRIYPFLYTVLSFHAFA